MKNISVYTYEKGYGFLNNLLFIADGYFLGSILFANIFGNLISHKNIVSESSDHNPGTVNAFKYGGFWCGILTLYMDLMKGFLPVFLYIKFSDNQNLIGTALVLSAPVIGHIFPVFHKFKGGKGIAASFGCLLGLIPMFGWGPVLCLALAFIMFSFVICITPNYYKTMFSYLGALCLMFIFVNDNGVLLGFGIISMSVMLRLLLSKEEKEEFKMRLLWKC